MPADGDATIAGHAVTLLGTGLIAGFYTAALHDQRGRDRVRVVYSRTAERAAAFAAERDIPVWTDDLDAAIRHPDTDVVVVGLPNHRHEDVIELCADAGKPVLCTKPLARNADEAGRILHRVEGAGIFTGYLEDLCYTPKALKAFTMATDGTIGDVTWVRSRESHPGPHSAWFWDGRFTGGGAIVDLGCHCIEIIRGTGGTIWLDHALRTGFEAFTTGRSAGYVAEKAEIDSGWLFLVGDEISEFGYVDMFTDMLTAMEAGRPPRETAGRHHGTDPPPAP